MRERIELNAELPPVVVDAEVMHEICRHALDVLPEECCGLISGDGRDRYRRVYRIANIMTRKHLADALAFPRDAHHAYYMSETEYLRAQQDAEGRGEQITAVYHSHVGADAYLSQEDLSYAEHPLFPYPEAAQIVVSVWDKTVGPAVIFEANGRARDGFACSAGRLLMVSGE